MKTTLVTVVLLALTLQRYSDAQERSNPEPAASSPKAAVETSGRTALEPEAKFKSMLTDAFLSGRWAPLKEGQLGEEKSGDKYNIVSAVKSSGDNWIINAKLKYRDQDFVLPIPVQVKFAGDTAIMIVDKLTIPNGGTYSARVIFFDGTYSGTWSGARGGGMLYGVITHGTNPASPGADVRKESSSETTRRSPTENNQTPTAK